MTTSLCIFVMFILLVCMTHQGKSTSESGDDYVRDACSVTQYRDLCIHSLASFSNSAKRSPRRWARAAVSVTLGEAKSVAQYLWKLKESGRMRRRQQIALSDCIECFQDTIDDLQNSLAELRRLDTKAFDTQMGNIETWMSAALTYEDTCLDGFDGRKGQQVRMLHNKVLNVTYFTSNALALVNKLASVGG